MYHKIIIVGNLGRDPEMRYLPNGTAVTNINVATSRRYTRSDGSQVDETTWFRVSVWGRQAETVNEYLAKGRKVLVEGRLRPDDNGNPRIWTRQDGTAAASFEVTADSVRFIGGRDEGDASGEGDYADSAPAQEEEDIPF